MCHSSLPNLAGVVDHCRSIAGWDVVGAGVHALLRARGVKKSVTDYGEKFIFTAKRSDYGTGRMRYSLYVAGKWADKSLCAGGRNCG